MLENEEAKWQKKIMVMNGEGMSKTAGELISNKTPSLGPLKSKRDPPGGSVVKNLPCNAGDVGSIFGQCTKILRAVERPPTADTTEPVSSGAHAPQLLKPVCHKERSYMMQRRSHVPQLKPRAAKSTNKICKKKKKVREGGKGKDNENESRGGAWKKKRDFQRRWRFSVHSHPNFRKIKKVGSQGVQINVTGRCG